MKIRKGITAMVNKTLLNEVARIVRDACVSVMIEGSGEWPAFSAIYLLELYDLGPCKFDPILALLSSSVPRRILFSDSTFPQGGYTDLCRCHPPHLVIVSMNCKW
ncbi:hypothetical protein DVH24_001307 [Malus domestica]|uniref:Uncharacterized protein n=1 Tax=Malus domestica TaxID=3750 RepID=A0A498K5V6_MALDO|nr:hypothetical protein DVH24_001307 [Malus domestica]